MTVLHVLVLILGLIAAIALADVLGQRDIGTWPAGVLALVLLVLGGLLYSSWIAALALGFAVGAGVALLGGRIREARGNRRPPGQP